MLQPTVSRETLVPLPQKAAATTTRETSPAAGSRRALAQPTAFALGLLLALGAAAHAIAAPQQLSPADGAALANVNITFTWSSVPFAGGAKYGIQIQYLEHPSTWKNYKTVDNINWFGGWYTFANFTKSQHGRWRVRTMTPTGNSPYSGWRLFTLENAGGSVPPGVFEVSRSLDLTAHRYEIHVLPCPAGTIVVGGGWRSGRPHHVHTSVNVQRDNGWVVTFENLTTSTKTVEVFAQCLQGVSGYSFSVANLWNVPANPPAGALGAPMATCKKGVRSGGGFRAASKDLAVFASEPANDPDPHSWLVFAHNGGAATQPLYAEAVCLVGTGATTKLAYSAAQSASPSGTVTASVACPPGRVSLSGGVATGTHSVVPMSSRRDGTGWKASGYNSGTQNGLLNAHAVCAKL